MTAKTPKQASTPAAASKAPQSAKKSEAQLEAKSKQTPAKKSEAQLAQEAKSKQTPAKSLKKQEEESESDEDDKEEMEAFTSHKKPSKADPEDEEMDEEEEGDEEDEEDDDNVFHVVDHLGNGNQLGITVPAGSAIHVIGASTDEQDFPLHITHACLGPNAAANDRASLVATMISDIHDHDHDHEDDEEEDEEHEHEEAISEIVCCTLVRDKVENAPLDLMLVGNFILINMSKESDIHVTARLVAGEEDEDYEDFDDGEEEEEDDDDENGNLDNSRVSLEESDSEDSDKEDPKKVQDTRKRYLESGATETKKTKVTAATPAPKMLDIKPSDAKKGAATTPAAKPAAAAAASAAKPTGNKPSEQAVLDAVLKELKEKKTMKNTDLGSFITKVFKAPYKTFGFEEKTLTKFLESKAKGKVIVTPDAVSIA